MYHNYLDMLIKLFIDERSFYLLSHFPVVVEPKVFVGQFWVQEDPDKKYVDEQTLHPAELHVSQLLGQAKEIIKH